MLLTTLLDVVVYRCCMVYERGQLVALAVGGGGAVVAAVVLAYLIKKYRDSTQRKSQDDGEKKNAISAALNNDAASSRLVPEESRSSSASTPSPSSGESTPTTSAWTAGDFRSSFQLGRPIDFQRLSQSSGISEVESPSFEELLAIETEVIAEEASEIKLPSNPVKRSSTREDDYPVSPETASMSHTSPVKDGGALDFDSTHNNNNVAATIHDVDGRPDILVMSASFNDVSSSIEDDSDDVFEIDSGVASTAGTVFSDVSGAGELPDAGYDAPLEAKSRHAALSPILPDVENREISTPKLPSPSKFHPSSSRASSASSANASPRPGSATLDDIEEQTTVLSPSESRALVAFLSSTNLATVRRALLIAVNAATFPANRYFLRRAGCIPALNRFLDPEINDEDVVDASVKALSNLAVDEANLEYMRDCLAPLMAHAARKRNETRDYEAIRLDALICLTNLTKTSIHHEHFAPFVDDLLGIVDDAQLSLDARLQSLKILNNLSVHAAVAPAILASRSLHGLNKWLALTPTGKPHEDASYLEFALNVCHLLSNLLEMTFGEGGVATNEWMDRVVEREETLLGALASEVRAVTIRSLLFDLNRHPEPDVRVQGKRLYALLAPLWRRCRAAGGKVIVEEEN